MNENNKQQHNQKHKNRFISRGLREIYKNTETGHLDEANHFEIKMNQNKRPGMMNTPVEFDMVTMDSVKTRQHEEKNTLRSFEHIPGEVSLYGCLAKCEIQMQQKITKLLRNQNETWKM